MPKRTAEEKIERYNRKIQRLQEKQQTKRTCSRRIISSDSEDEQLQEPEEVVNTNEAYIYEESIPEIAYYEPLPGPSTAEDAIQPAAPAVIETVAPASATADPSTVECPVEEATSEIIVDPELLAALGDSTAESPEYGPKILENLAMLWNPLLKKGMSKENKEKLFENYPIPDNCRLLQAPKLNAEMSPTVLSDMVRNRDKKLMHFQQQLGHGVTAVNRAMDILLKTDNKAEALKHLSDSCRILSDFHSMFTQYRVKLINPSLDKSFLAIVQDTERDETLFGNTLGEKIRASGTIHKQGLQIKKNVPNQNKPMPSTSGRPNQGNWSGPPPRYHQPTNRGGRRCPRRPIMSVVRRPYPYHPPAPPAPQARMPFSNRPRAPFQ
ncbi:unnamed protein product [Plutella xylostella]|uniref:(diamondback moth) hypothetical protein n=2 Tax=Plutella xylostella TaxID=51655 RepID=A0A8S4D0M8_PLUXY|nr:unnamed protein product [Plutella xylostella]